jgi:hypothetical protein
MPTIFGDADLWLTPRTRSFFARLRLKLRSLFAKIFADFDRTHLIT